MTGGLLIGRGFEVMVRLRRAAYVLLLTTTFQLYSHGDQVKLYNKLPTDYGSLSSFVSFFVRALELPSVGQQNSLI